MAGMLRIAWNVIIAIVEIVVVLAMLGAARSPFETIVISALVYIFTAMVGSFALLGQASVQVGNQALARYIALARALHVNVDIEAEAHAENLIETEKHAPAFWIGMVSRSVIALIATVALIRVLWPGVG